MQNDLLIFSEWQNQIITESMLELIDLNELKVLCKKSSLMILGGLGFSGLNKEFNATQGIYRQTIKSLDEDIEQSNRFESICKKVKKSIGNDKVIVLTHTNKSDWTNEEYNRNWIYVNGHTHLNDYCCNEEKTVYADNQIGYNSSSIGLKCFHIGRNYDIFRNLNDGIYSITREEFKDFNRGKGISPTFNNTEGVIHMLKNNGVYCFIYEKNKTGKIYIMNGGMLKTLDHQNIQYYFDRMKFYSDAIKELLSGYHNVLKNISNSVKMIGGLGKFTDVSLI